VHHIVPISEIGKEYIVDPIRDLVPVCPNCHMALHSKKDGVYTIEELRAIRQSVEK
jgi:5-methylcytosine-specific restriction protein A